MKIAPPNSKQYVVKNLPRFMNDIDFRVELKQLKPMVYDEFRRNEKRVVRRKEFDKMTPLGKLQQMGRNLKSWIVPKKKYKPSEPIPDMPDFFYDRSWPGRK